MPHCRTSAPDNTSLECGCPLGKVGGAIEPWGLACVLEGVFPGQATGCLQGSASWFIRILETSKHQRTKCGKCDCQQVSFALHSSGPLSLVTQLVLRVPTRCRELCPFWRPSPEGSAMPLLQSSLAIFWWPIQAMGSHLLQTHSPVVPRDTSLPGPRCLFPVSFLCTLGPCGRTSYPPPSRALKEPSCNITEFVYSQL